MVEVVVRKLVEQLNQITSYVDDKSGVDVVGEIDVFKQLMPFCTGPVEQLNQITSYVDASQVYGSSISEQRFLRTFRRGGCLVSTAR